MNKPQEELYNKAWKTEKELDILKILIIYIPLIALVVSLFAPGQIALAIKLTTAIIMCIYPLMKIMDYLLIKK